MHIFANIAPPGGTQIFACPGNFSQVCVESVHIFAYYTRMQVGEHSDLAQPATVDLQKVFGQVGLRLTTAVETTLSANRLLEEVDKTKHKWHNIT